jgi:glycosyltransferase involved in cell wall biosynthesis
LQERRDWLGTDKQRLNELIANDCDGIVTGLYEYQVCYEPKFPDKTQFIPFPIVVGERPAISPTPPERLRLFIGINRTRSEYKGTDIMLRAAQDVQAAYPDKVELRIAENIPFEQYVELMNGSDAILDQLYSYTPSMNPLEAMTKGIICIGGGEPENYAILGEEELRPIVNVQPTYESVRHELEQLVMHLERVPQLREESWQYVKRHHDYLKVARQYEQFYLKKH